MVTAREKQVKGLLDEYNSMRARQNEVRERATQRIEADRAAAFDALLQSNDRLSLPNTGMFRTPEARMLQALQLGANSVPSVMPHHPPETISQLTFARAQAEKNQQDALLQTRALPGLPNDQALLLRLIQDNTRGGTVNGIGVDMPPFVRSSHGANLPFPPPLAPPSSSTENLLQHVLAESKKREERIAESLTATRAQSEPHSLSLAHRGSLIQASLPQSRLTPFGAAPFPTLDPQLQLARILVEQQKQSQGFAARDLSFGVASIQPPPDASLKPPLDAQSQLALRLMAQQGQVELKTREKTISMRTDNFDIYDTKPPFQQTLLPEARTSDSYPPSVVGSLKGLPPVQYDRPSAETDHSSFFRLNTRDGVADGMTQQVLRESSPDAPVVPSNIGSSEIISWDVLFRQDETIDSSYPGNCRFRSLVHDLKSAYDCADEVGKHGIVCSIVCIVRKNGGRWLKMMNDLQLVEVGDLVAEQKVHHALREACLQVDEALDMPKKRKKGRQDPKRHRLVYKNDVMCFEHEPDASNIHFQKLVRRSLRDNHTGDRAARFIVLEVWKKGGRFLKLDGGRLVEIEDELAVEMTKKALLNESDGQAYAKRNKNRRDKIRVRRNQRKLPTSKAHNSVVVPNVSEESDTQSVASRPPPSLPDPPSCPPTNDVMTRPARPFLEWTPR